MAKQYAEALVQVLYARPEKQVIVELNFQPGMTAAEAVESSGIRESISSVSDENLVLGVWGVAVAAGHPLEPGDRVEISRPLQADPRAMRRELMTDGRVMGGAQATRAGVKKKGRE